MLSLNYGRGRQAAQKQYYSPQHQSFFNTQRPRPPSKCFTCLWQLKLSIYTVYTRWRRKTYFLETFYASPSMDLSILQYESDAAPSKQDWDRENLLFQFMVRIQIRIRVALTKIQPTYCSNQFANHRKLFLLGLYTKIMSLILDKLKPILRTPFYTLRDIHHHLQALNLYGFKAGDPIPIQYQWSNLSGI